MEKHDNGVFFVEKKSTRVPSIGKLFKTVVIT